MCEKQMAPNWRKPQPSAFQGTCVPSPQSSSVSDEPLRTRAHDNQRPGMGIMPHVPNIQISITTINSLLTSYSDMPRPIPPINLERMQAATRDLAAFLGIALPEYSHQKQ